MSATKKKTAKTRKKPRLSAGKARAAAKKAENQSCWWALPVSCLTLVMLAVCLFFVIHEIGEYRRFRVMRAEVEKAGYYNGIVVEGYSLSGVSYQTALEHWQNVIEPAYRDRSVTLTANGMSWTKTATELGYQSNYESVLGQAWSLGRSGTLEERYRSISNILQRTERYTVDRTEFSEKLLREWTDAIADSLTVQARSASITSFDVNTKKFALSASSNGTAVDKDALYQSALDTLKNGGGSVSIRVETVKPDVSSDDISGKFGLISSAVTNASSSSKDRITNIKLACAAINGYCVQPGATFSFNTVVGQRTTKKGYKVATVYQSGELAEDIGGGVCQVSTTVWNAAMKANCSIVERHEHSRPVSYVDRGKDATVSWNSQDMKFKNISAYPMYVVAYVTDSKRVYCEIYGEMFPDGKYITIEAKTTQTIEPDPPSYKYNPVLPEGQKQTVTEARKGYKAKAWRVYHNADGSEISRELLCESYYRPARAVIEYG